MEEVWKDINLSSLHDQHSRSDHDFSVSTPMSLPVHHPHHHHHHQATANFRSIILQDFLSSSSSRDPAPPSCILATPTDTTLFSSTAGSQAPPAAPPTVLSLNSSRELHFLDNPGHFRPNLHSQCQPISNASFHSPFDQVLGSPTSGLPSFGKKRVQDSDCNNSGDRRQKRMIKNRESAARSRARKQAYTNELELEVAHLMEENARLRRQQEQLSIAAASQVPRKHRLHRTSTAPF